MYIGYDIETIPNPRAFEYFHTVKKYKAPVNYKDPGKIEAYIEEQRLEDVQKAGLYWWTGQVICICITNPLSGITQTFYGQDEKQLLMDFQTFLKLHCANYTLIGKHAHIFDKPFLIGRILAHNIGLLERFRSPIRDVNEMFSTSHSCSQISNLNAYAFGLGLDLKQQDGGNVFNLWKDERHDEIKEYCKHDTFIVAEMLRRYGKRFDG